MSEERKTGALVALLLGHASRVQRAELEAIQGLEALLHQHVEAARAAWPTLQLTSESFVRHLPAGKAEEVLRLIHGADLYLACACGTGERAALLAFEQHLLRDIPGQLGALSPSMVEEVMQLLRERLLVGSEQAPPKNGSYGGRGPLLTWVGITRQPGA